MGKKVLVTGAGGFVGIHLVKQLSERGYEVTASSTAMPWYLKKDPMPNVTFAPADLRDRSALDKLVAGHETVYHLGAIFNFYAPQKELESVNVIGTRNLAEAACDAGVKKFIYFSSGAIYGPGEGEEAVDENTFPRPTDNYAASKWEGEKIAFDMNSRNGMRVVTVRPGAIYGPYSVYGDALALWLLKKGLLVGIPGIGRVVSSHVHVEDCAAAAIHLAEHPETGKEGVVSPHDIAYNVCDDEPTPNEDLIKAASKAIPHKGLVGFFSFLRLPTPMLKMAAWFAEQFAKVTNTKPLFDRVSIDYITTHRGLSNKKLKATGFNLKYPVIFDGLPDTIRWYEETGWKAFRVERYNWN